MLGPEGRTGLALAVVATAGIATANTISGGNEGNDVTLVTIAACAAGILFGIAPVPGCGQLLPDAHEHRAGELPSDRDRLHVEADMTIESGAAVRARGTVGYGSQIGYGTQIGCRDSGDLLVQIEDDVTIGERINLKVAALLALGPRSRIKADATCSGQLTLAAEASIKKHAHFEGGVVHEAERVPEHAVIRARWCPIHLDDGASRAAGGIHPTATIAEGVTLGR